MTSAILPFAPSRQGSLGVELELQLVNTRDYNLTTDAPDLLRRLESGLGGGLKPEVTQSMVEINSSVHTAHGELLAELVATRDALAREARRMNIAIAGGGTHPFQRWSERRIFPTERFLSVSETYGYLAKQFTVFGQHIHVGCASGDEALALAHVLARFVPHFIALAASSPFYQGADTAFDSSRLSVVNAFPLSGTLPWVHAWADFEAYFARMVALGVVKSMKDFYWDVRPKPEYGTVEIRVCDTPLTVERAADLAAYAQALALWRAEAAPPPPERDLYLVYGYNRFQACRYGLGGRLVVPGEGETAVAEDILRTVRTLEPYARRLGCGEALDRLAFDAARGHNDAATLRGLYLGSGTFTDTVREQAALWMGA